MRAGPLAIACAALLLVAPGMGCGGGKSPSEPDPVCTFAISPAAQSFGSEGGTASVAVTTGSGCTWTSASAATWIAVTAGQSGTGPGATSYAVQANDSSETRSATLTIAGQTHTVTQQGRAAPVCVYTLSADSARFSKDAGSGTVAVTAPAGCAWSATSSAGWLAVTSGSPGSGSGTVSFTVSRNLSATSRTASLTIADRTFTVSQDGDTGTCSFSVAPVAFAPCMGAGTVTAEVTTASGCPWTISDNASWLTIAGGDERTGPGRITASFTDNYDAPREAVIEVRWPTPTAGQNIRVAQAGCVYGVSRTTVSVPAAGATGTIDVVQQSVPTICGGPLQDRCVWTARSDVSWIVVTSSMPRTGDNPFSYTVSPHTGATSRVGHIRVRDITVTVTQAGQ